MKIALVISSLEVGGAESQFCLIAGQLKDDGHEVEVWPLRKRGDFVAPIEDAGIPVRDLGKRSKMDLLRPSINLWRYTKALLPDAIFCSLPSACLHALVAKFTYPNAVFCWQIVATQSTLPNYGFLAGLGYVLQRRLAGSCDHYISNSRAGAVSAVQDGFSRDKMHVLQNGIDTSRFYPDPDSGEHWLMQNKLNRNRPTIGIVGRLDPAKDHDTFFKAVNILEALSPGIAQYIVVGWGSGAHADAVINRIEELRKQGIAVVHVPHQGDMPPMYNACNIFTMSSISEGLPNALLEALACGSFCVVTNVGDCAEVVAKDGVVVEIRDHVAIAKAWRMQLDSDEYDGAKQSQRVHAKYGLKPMVSALSKILAQKKPSWKYLL
ncbi:MAG: glycosyltransferase [Proteobacteria bacterium]|jgi:glycosyltransferase involved in cell wall biosynthesis|nr:glycosyltransferase [Pseudomonadota bacterium]